MTLQTIPVTTPEGFVDTSGNPLRDLPFIGPSNTLRPLFRLRPVLEGTGYQLSLVWMQLSAQWLARELLTREGDTITLGIPLTSSGVDLLAMLSSKANRPPGKLWYTFAEGLDGAPGRFDWRERATLYYRPAALVSALAGSDRMLL